MTYPIVYIRSTVVRVAGRVYSCTVVVTTIDDPVYFLQYDDDVRADRFDGSTPRRISRGRR